MNLPLSSLDRLDDVLFNLDFAELPGAIAELSQAELAALKEQCTATHLRLTGILGRVMAEEVVRRVN